eukprot:TRINITY_DN18104_c0_g1_i1.p1 TRINITY_DN18104_c0_g1~~TRINITY_DN18104_c0_g1_i1.p1  ORF type:complete len:168 (-),score=9.07 TRINITY_DN18104_c0_g1_i1:70-525(-)
MLHPDKSPVDKKKKNQKKTNTFKKKKTKKCLFQKIIKKHPPCMLIKLSLIYKLTVENQKKIIISSFIIKIYFNLSLEIILDQQGEDYFGIFILGLFQYFYLEDLLQSKKHRNQVNNHNCNNGNFTCNNNNNILKICKNIFLNLNLLFHLKN